MLHIVWRTALCAKWHRRMLLTICEILSSNVMTEPHGNAVMHA